MMGRGGTIEIRPGVAGEKEALGTEILPHRCKIRERSSPVFLFLVDVGSVAELIGAIGYLCEVTLVILSVFFECDFRTDFKEWRKEVGIVGHVD
jgi:hypothetical protein